MTGFSGSPRVLKGAIVGVDSLEASLAVIVFQYNPDTLTRSLQAQAAGAREGDRSEPMRLKGAPVETIKLDVEIDATDQLERSDPVAASLGIAPQLSALEILLYPKSSTVIANTVLLAGGTIEVIPPVAPLTLFIWGAKRIVPVRLTDFSITEEAHDPSLNPIRAKVSLGMRILTYDDLPATNLGFGLFLAHQTVKEAMAAVGNDTDLGAVAGGNVRLL